MKTFTCHCSGKSFEGMLVQDVFLRRWLGMPSLLCYLAIYHDLSYYNLTSFFAHAQWSKPMYTGNIESIIRIAMNQPVLGDYNKYPLSRSYIGVSHRVRWDRGTSNYPLNNGMSEGCWSLLTWKTLGPTWTTIIVLEAVAFCCCSRWDNFRPFSSDWIRRGMLVYCGKMLWGKRPKKLFMGQFW